MIFLRAIVLLGVAASARFAICQQLHWQITAPSTEEHDWMCSYNDFNGDGFRDVLELVFVDLGLPTQTQAHRILSGLDGSTLWERSDPEAQRMVDGGDIDGDGVHDIVMRHMGSPLAPGIEIAAWSVGGGQWIWHVVGPFAGFGDAMLGDIDLTGDGLADFVTSSISTLGSDIFAYDSQGALLYTIPCFSQGLAAASFAKMGDIDQDGCDDYVVGCQDVTLRGALLVVSGRLGTILRTSYGILPGDIIAAHASNMGDMDGDGAPDYAGFPWWSASRAMITVFSGSTGSVIRTWPTYGESVIAGEDVDRDGVPDLVLGADFNIVPQQVYGRTLAFSGRDGSELWRVDNVPTPPGGGSVGTTNWMFCSAKLGIRVGDSYPSVAWLDRGWWVPGTNYGRIRAFGTARAGQGLITGIPCTSSGQMPLIGVRKLGVGAANTGFRTTVAKTHANAIAALNFSLSPLPSPIDMTVFGFSGCTVYVDPIASYLRLTGVAGIDRGYAAVDLPYPLSAATTGTDVFAQWLVLEPTNWDYAATEMHAIQLP